MRGIVFIGGEGPPPERRRALSKGAGLIVAADSGLTAAEDAGVAVDLIVGDMDSLDDPGRLEKYPPGRIFRYPPDKDDTDTELALRLLWDRGCDEAWLIGGGGGRTDHLLAIRSLFERDRKPDRWVTSREDIFYVREGAVFSPPPDVWGAARRGGGGVSVFPLETGPWRAESWGLAWPLNGLSWNRGFFGVSNAAPEGDFEIRALQGGFLVIAVREDEDGGPGN
ncbi:MAG: thiamine diphosphokinase [Spirochaetaceae bacterium]|jgi:thiamine pyrophosphokinase|nr:thiamine diphosphokinase [Spirochaetaceae bacterium]